VDGEATFTLLRGAEYAKDNRIPPKGFTSSFAAYSDVAIRGSALQDKNFGKSDDGREGSGSDLVEYRIPVAGHGGEFNIVIEMCYQTISPRFAEHLFARKTEVVAKFEEYYRQADITPVIMKKIELSTKE